MTNKNNTVLYAGMTNNLVVRIHQHKNGLNEGFTKRYNINKLVFYEIFSDVNQAIQREKQIKAGSRKRKLLLIKKMNPDWRDLSDDFL